MPTNRPTSSELIQAVQSFLKTEVMPALGGSTKYHLQVALTALSIVGRELTGADQLDAAEHARLRELLGMQGSREELNGMLCASIRARGFTYRDAALFDHLLKTTMGKMSIDNPKYATYSKEKQE